MVQGSAILLIRQRNADADNPPVPLGIANDFLDGGPIDLAEARQECPLIGIRQTPLIEEDAISEFPRLLLQRQGNQIAEAALGKRILIGEETIVGIQADIRTAFHGLGQDVRTESACQGRGNGLGEEQPNVPAVAAARSLQGGRQVHAAACLQDGSCIFLPMCLIEIGCQEEAGLVLKHGVHAHDEITAIIVSAREVPVNHFVGDGKKAAMRASGAFDLGLLAQASRPLVGTRRLIAGLAALAALEATRIDIVASTEERAKQSDLGFG